MAMQDKRGSKVPNRKSADQGTTARSPLDEDRVAELVEVLRDAGYDCERSVEPNLPSP